MKRPMNHSKWRWSRYNVVSGVVSGEVLIYNTLTQSLAQASASELAVLREGRSGIESESQAAIRAGLLVPEGRDEFRYAAAARAALLRDDEDNLDLVISPTLACNFACEYCFHGVHHKLGKVDVAVNRALAYAEDKLRPDQLLSVTWYGGEPTLVAEKIEQWSKKFQLLAHVRGADFSAQVITNGSRFKYLSVEWFERCSIQEIQVSVDWPIARSYRHHDHDTPRGTLQEVLKTLDLIPSGVKVLLRINLYPDFLRTFDQCIRMLQSCVTRRLHVYTHQLIDTRRSGGEYEHRDMIEFRSAQLQAKHLLRQAGFEQAYFPRQLSKAHCTAQSRTAAIFGPDGQLRKCYAEVVGLGAAVDDAGMPNTRAEQLANSEENLHPVCRDCTYYPVCHGGCPKGAVDEPALIQKRCTPWRFTLETELTELLINQEVNHESEAAATC